MLKYFSYLVLLISINGCASDIVGDPDKPISLITVKAEGKNDDGRPAMASVCKGFYLTRKEVTEFYLYSNIVDEPGNADKYEILPCYSSGTAAINGKLYDWVIRAGGIGIFKTKDDQFIKICGKACCQKLPRIC